MPEQCSNALENPIYKTVTVVRMYGTSMFAVLIWDWLVTLRKEYDYMWKSSWTIIKALFLFLRYWTLFVFPFPLAMWDGNFTLETCQTLHRLEPALCMPIVWAAEGILLLRAYAIWEKNKVVLAAGIIGLLCVAAAQMVCVMTVVVLPLPPGTQTFACVATGKPGPAGGRLAIGYWLAPFVFDSTVTGLTLLRSLGYRRGGADSSILKTFVTQGLLYFILISLTNLVNVAFFLQSNQALQPINALMAILATSLFAQRLVIQLRSVGLAGTSHHSHSHSGPFGHGTSSKGTAKEGHIPMVGLQTIGGSQRTGPTPRHSLHSEAAPNSAARLHYPASPSPMPPPHPSMHAYGGGSRATSPQGRRTPSGRGRQRGYPDQLAPANGVAINFSHEIDYESDADATLYGDSIRRGSDSPKGGSFQGGPGGGGNGYAV